MDDGNSATVLSSADGEESLLARLRAGEESAYEEIVRRYGPQMLITAQRILGNEHDARDAVQDAFLAAFRKLSTFEGASRLGTWLHRIAINSALNRLRSRQRKHERSIDELLPRFLHDGHQAEPARAWKEPPEVAIQRQETRALVHDAIAQLPENYRIVLLMRDIEGLDTEETTRQLGLTTAVVRTRLHRARQALRTLLDEHFRELVP